MDNRRVIFIRLALVIVLLFSLMTWLAAADIAPATGHPAPAFVLSDVNGKKRSLAEFRGRPVALFFFCGCSWCADVAREWATLQRSHALDQSHSGSLKAPITLIVYQGGVEEARSLAAAYGLDPAETVLLPDPQLTVTLQTYNADPCPRVFVVDRKGILRYSNTGKDDLARKAPAMVIVSRTIDALRAAGEKEQTKKVPDPR
jgi:peroxiredoxin